MDPAEVSIPSVTPRRVLEISCLLLLSVAAVGCGGGKREGGAQPDLAREIRRQVKGDEKNKPGEKPVVPPTFKVSATGNKFTIDDRQGRRLIEAQVEKVDGTFQPGKGQQGVVKFAQAKCRLFQQGKPQMDMQAPFATWDGERLVADRTAHAVTSDGQTVVDAQHAVWTSDTGALDLRQAKVQGLKQGKLDFTAEGRVARVLGPTVTVPSGGKAWNPLGQQVEADRIVWQRETGKLDANGHVVLTDGETVITGRRLLADTRLKRGRITGGAKVVTKKPARQRAVARNSQ